jgi:ubiquinone/menaquinone biosynthesis C-methylase UbiE
MELEEIDKMYELEDTHWWFSAKRALVMDEIKKTNGGRLLDIGCGTGSTLSASQTYHTAVGCEFSKEALRLSKKRGIELLARSNAEQLPFKSGSFDVVTALDVIEHIDDDEAAIRELRRVMKPGGKAVISVPAHRFLWSEHDAMQHHKRRYVWEELKMKLQRNGLKVRKMSYWNFSLFPLSMVYKFFTKGSNIKQHGRLLNTLLYRLLRMDNWVVRHTGLPYGVSLFCIAEKV